MDLRLKSSALGDHLIGIVGIRLEGEKALSNVFDGSVVEALLFLMNNDYHLKSLEIRV